MITFDTFWHLLYNHGATTIKMRECAELWNSLSTEQQEQLYSSISTKLQEGRFVHYDPLRAMQENIRRQILPPAQPTNYNRSRDFDRMVATGTLVTANYNGEVGIYTEADATRHHMTIINHLRP